MTVTRADIGLYVKQMTSYQTSYFNVGYIVPGMPSETTMWSEVENIHIEQDTD